MAIFAGREKLENRTMAQNSQFIIGKKKLVYRDKQKTLLVLLWKLWNKKRSMKKTFQTRMKCIFTKNAFIKNNNNKNDIREKILKLLISTDIKTVWDVTTNDKRNVKFCNLQTVTIPGLEKKAVFFASISTCKGQLIQTAIEETTALFLRKH